MKKKVLRGLQLMTALIIMAAPAYLPAAAIQLNWQGNAEPDLHSYNVYYGTQSRNYGPPIAVGKETSHLVSGLADSTTYYFAISATDNSGNESGYSSEVTIKTGGSDDANEAPTDTVAPTLRITSPTSAGTFETDQGVLSISGEAADSGGIAKVTWKSDSGQSGTATGTTAWSISGIVLSEGQNLITVRAFDQSGNSDGASLQVMYAAPDQTAPSITITSPTSAGSFATDLNTITIAGQAGDDVGLAEIAWSSSSGGNGIAAGKASWTADNIALVPGSNVITVTATDTSGHQSQASLSVNCTYAEEVDLVSAVSAASGLGYEIQDNLTSGRRVYIDRTYTYSNLPQSLQGSTYIVTANDDKTVSADSFLSFAISRPATVYVAHDDRITAKPAWLKGFADTGLDLNSDTNMSIYSRGFDAGTVTLGGNGGSRNSSMYTVAVVAASTVSPPVTPTPEPLTISDLSASSGKSYQIENELAAGKRVYIDRAFLYANLPDRLKGVAYVMTANDDKTSVGSSFLSFKVNKPVTVYIAHDDRIETRPSWMAQFADTGLDLTTDVPMSIYARSYEAGTISLGGNGGDKYSSMYTVVIGE